MPKSVKPIDNIYLDSSGVIYNRELLKTTLSNLINFKNNSFKNFYTGTLNLTTSEQNIPYNTSLGNPRDCNMLFIEINTNIGNRYSFSFFPTDYATIKWNIFHVEDNGKTVEVLVGQNGYSAISVFYRNIIGFTALSVTKFAGIKLS